MEVDIDEGMVGPATPTDAVAAAAAPITALRILTVTPTKIPSISLVLPPPPPPPPLFPHDPPRLNGALEPLNDVPVRQMAAVRVNRRRRRRRRCDQTPVQESTDGRRHDS
mmetsp:Transcript_5753/g.10998  ORF Transcript_5753/g.10998 Transcript_5753/m.10998 type:complete len:110 (+) Transcript_5753:805-1134(+)